MSGTDATGIPARDGDGNTIPPPIAPAPVNPVAPPAPLAQDVSDTVILTAIGTLTSALGEMAPAPRTPGTVKTTLERCGPFSLVVLSQRRSQVTPLSGHSDQNASETFSNKLQLNKVQSSLRQTSAKTIQVRSKAKTS